MREFIVYLCGFHVLGVERERNIRDRGVRVGCVTCRAVMERRSKKRIREAKERARAGDE